MRQQRSQEINERSHERDSMVVVLLLKPQGARCDYRTNPKQSLILERTERSFDRSDSWRVGDRHPLGKERPVIIPDFGSAKEIVLTSKRNLRRANSSGS